MDREAWRATVHGVTKLDMIERLTVSLSHFQALLKDVRIKVTTNETEF